MPDPGASSRGAAAGVAPVGIAELLAEARSGLTRVTPADALRALGRGDLLVDIRSDLQRAADGHVPGAIHCSRNVLEWRADPACPDHDDALARRDVRLMLLCNEGYQSSLAAATLRRFGLDATDVIGGFARWRSDGLPVTPPPEAA